MNNQDIDKRLNKIKDRIIKPEFTEMRGLANEIAFYIFDYNPKDEPIVEKHIPVLIKFFDEECSNRKIANINLYNILIENLKKDNLLKEVFEMEKESSDEGLYNMLKNYARNDIFIKEIKEATENNDIIFITGISHIHPIIKSHELLSKLHEIIGDKKPVVLFYPGEFTGDVLKSFHKGNDHRYYRARPLIN